MDIRNLMEDYVKATVHELFDAEKKGSTSTWCSCDQCRMDVACYVLNRLKPEYVISGRGVAYSEQDYQEKLQKTADVVSLVREAWAKINSAPRPYHSHGAKHVEAQAASGPLYNLPPIMGRLFNGNNFEPIASGSIELHSDEGLMPMIDANWQNPYPMVQNTAGTFIFWPSPAAAASVGEKKRFSFTIAAALSGFDALSHFLELDLEAEAEAVRSFSLAKVHKLPDLYVFPA